MKQYYTYLCAGCGRILIQKEIPGEIDALKHLELSSEFDEERERIKQEHEIPCIREVNPAYNPNSFFNLDLAKIKRELPPYQLVARFRKHRGYGYTVSIEPRAPAKETKVINEKEIKGKEETVEPEQKIEQPTTPAVSVTLVFFEEAKEKKKKKKKKYFPPKPKSEKPEAIDPAPV